MIIDKTSPSLGGGGIFIEEQTRDLDLNES